MKNGFLYILSNPSFRTNMYKIGFTTRTVELRASELFRGASGVPTPFSIESKLPVLDCELAERLIHRKLKKFRFADDREYFLTDLASIKHICNHVVDDVNYLFDDADSGYHYVSMRSPKALKEQKLRIKKLAEDTSELMRYLVGDRVWTSGIRLTYSDFTWTDQLYEETSELLFALEDLKENTDNSIKNLSLLVTHAGEDAKLAVCAYIRDDDGGFDFGFATDWIYLDVVSQLQKSGFVAVSLNGKRKSWRYGVIDQVAEQSWHCYYLDQDKCIASKILTKPTDQLAVFGIVSGTDFRLLTNNEIARLNLLNHVDQK